MTATLTTDQRLSGKLDLTAALRIAHGVFEQYKVDQRKWWKRMDGTPILNDVAVRMAAAFVQEINRPARLRVTALGSPHCAYCGEFVSGMHICKEPVG